MCFCLSKRANRVGGIVKETLKLIIINDNEINTDITGTTTTANTTTITNATDTTIKENFRSKKRRRDKITVY